MAWGLTDDKLHSHRKTLRIPRVNRCEAMGLWTLVNSWCNDHGTDGAVPRDIWDEFGTSQGTAQLLVSAGFWEEAEDGYQVVNWAEYNKTSKELAEKRAAEAERKRKWREAKAKKRDTDKSSSEGGPSDVPVGQGGQSADVTSESALSHTHTHTQVRDRKTRATASREADPPGFAEFWQAYPQRRDRRKAVAAFRRALKRADAEAIIEGARRYAADPNREDGYTKYAEGWLNGDRWLDGPLPPRGRTGPGVTTRPDAARDQASGLLVER